MPYKLNTHLLDHFHVLYIKNIIKKIKDKNLSNIVQHIIPKMLKIHVFIDAKKKKSGRKKCQNVNNGYFWVVEFG